MFFETQYIVIVLEYILINQSVNQFIYFRPHESIVNRGQTTGR